MQIRMFLIALLLSNYTSAGSQCFISAPTQVCAGDCGPVFWLINDPPGTTYSWSIGCGTITNPTMANPHTACFDSAGICRIDVLVTRPGQVPDTCTTFVLVLPTTEEEIVEIICFGDSVEVNGTYYTPGLYMDTIFGGNIYGCDSFLTILVAEIPPMYDTISFTSCSGSGDSIVVNGTIYNEGNPTGTEYVIGSTGCVESIIEIDLTFLPNSSSVEIYLGCQGDGYSIVVDSVIYDESNPMGIDTLTGSNGCDSVVTIMLIFNPVYLDIITYLGCTGDTFSITIDSIVYDESNPTGMDTLITVNGCDSIITIDLVFMPPSYDTITYEGCMGDGYSVMVMDSVFNEDNPTGTVIIETSACDSIIFVDLHFADCPDSLVLSGHELCVSGTGTQYTWYTCYGIPLPDTTQCITVGDTGCVCVIFTDGSGFDTLCLAYNLCDLNCDIIAPDQACIGDSVLVTFASNDSSLAVIDWVVMLDSNSMQMFTATDSLWLVYNVPGCYTIQLQLQDSGCITSCTDTICVSYKPIADLCCDQVECDTCVTLTVFLFGTSPWTIAISDGTTIDTISGITNSPYDFLVCPPYDTNIIYTLLWVQDSLGYCNGDIINDSVSVYLEQRPVASITVAGDTLCAQPNGFAYGWFDCQMTSNLSFNQCFVPTASGCYCVTVSTLLTDCIDSACVNFILSSTHSPGTTEDIRYGYDPEHHAIFIGGVKGLNKDLQIQLLDILGRNIGYTNKEFVDEDLIRISLPEHTPSLLFLSVHSQQFRYTRGVYVPTY